MNKMPVPVPIAAHPMPAADQRIHTVLRIARVTSRESSHLAIVRTLSTLGMTLEIHPDQHLSGPVEIAIGLGQVYYGTIRYRRETCVAIRFDAPIDVERALERPATDEKGRPMRLPRVAVSYPAEVQAEDLLVKAEIRDIAPGGARLALEKPIEIGAKAILRVPMLGAIPGVIRWAAHGHAGFSFDRPASIHGLMAWLALGARQPAIAQGAEPVWGRPCDSQSHLAPKPAQEAALVTALDRDGHLVAATPAFLDLLGSKAESLLGNPFEVLLSGAHAPGLSAEICARVTQCGEWRGDLCCINAAGEAIWLETVVIPNPAEDRGPGVFTLLHRDITREKADELDLWHIANFDPLTGLPNRASFIEFLSALLANPQALPAALHVLVFDLDNFATINDRCGPAFGDLLLAEIGTRLRNAVSGGDISARIGGDRFAVIMRGCKSADQARWRALGIASQVGKPVLIDGREEQITACGGIADYPRSGHSHFALLRNADIALRTAKHEGPNRIVHFDSAMLAESERRNGMLDSFSASLSADEIQVHYQPIVAISSPAPLRLEALCRWMHPEHGLLDAAYFRDVFHDEALARRIGLLVVDTVIGSIENWRRGGLPFGSVAINATLADLRAPDFVDALLAATAEGRVAPDEIGIEITEEVLLAESVPCVRAEIERLHAAGLTVIIADFGAGYSSLRHLRDMPIGSVKIDRSFVSGITSSDVDFGIAENIVDLAHMLHKQVIAEGVETLEQLELLDRIGCDFAQGHFIARPMPAEEAEQFIREYANCLAPDGHGRPGNPAKEAMP